jgi:hypothetical protein
MFDLALVGLHLFSDHHPSLPYQNNHNLGAYVETVEGWTVGGYRNTLDRTSLYAGWTWRPVNHLALTLGGVSGYRKETRAISCPELYRRHKIKAQAGCYETLGWSNHAIAPMVAPSLEAGPARLWYIPKAGNASSVIHLSVQWRW